MKSIVILSVNYKNGNKYKITLPIPKSPVGGRAGFPNIIGKGLCEKFITNIQYKNWEVFAACRGLEIGG